jgi:UDP-N-acetylmuramoyl-L-alanyl-D-glutamate--2,6-diaminopimelate ligase
MKKIIKKIRILRRKMIAFLASCHFYGNASKKIKVIGITGTNGKTTIATLLYELFTQLGYKVGLISTVENIIIDKVYPTTHTTPGPIALNKILNKMVQEGCQYVFMEVSSHGLDQKRVAGIKFTGGIFTNLTHDHLDYHKNIDNYFKAKKKFFQMLPRKAFALSNLDDEHGKKMLEGIKASKYFYALKREAFFQEYLETKLLGEFNAYNILAVYATAVLLGENEAKSSQVGSPDSFRKEFRDKVKEILKNLDGAEGRFQGIKSNNNIIGIVDFAHTPDALENVLNTIQNLNSVKVGASQNIITVFGCGGGERKDHTKRPIMTKIVYDRSDIMIATADNPREENIENIFKDMKKGLPTEVLKEVYFIADRGEAIKKACQLAQKGDYILLAGKGHEKTQEINGVKYPFNDMEELRKHLN